MKETDKLPGCRQYKQVSKNKSDKTESQLKCQVCWKDFDVKDGECTFECDKKKSTASETCNYTDDHDETITNQFYCLQEKVSPTGLYMPVKNVDADCAIYKTWSEKDVNHFLLQKFDFFDQSQIFSCKLIIFLRSTQRCQKCMQGNVSVEDDCV